MVSGPQRCNVSEHLAALYALDSRIAAAAPALLPLDSPQELLRFLTVEHNSDTYLWHDESGALVGYLSVIDDRKRDALEVLNVGVDPDSQGSGHGRAMMDYANTLARDAGRRRVVLVTNVKNAAARRFYERLGFAAVSEIADHYGDGETRIAFEKHVDR